MVLMTCCDGDTPDEKKKRTPRLPEKYCFNKTATLAIVPGADNSNVQRILQWKLK
jgi:hypothetical protein